MPLDKDLTEFSTASQSIVSFDFQDIASGQLFKTFWILNTEDNASAQEYTLIDDSSLASSIVDGSEGTFNCDTGIFNVPRTVKGVAYVNIGVSIGSASSGSISCKLQKWDGSSATDITSAIVESISSDEDRVISMRMPCTETLIPEGEQIRLVVVITESSGNVFWGHDPTGRDGVNVIPSSQGSNITSSNIKIPFKFDG